MSVGRTAPTIPRSATAQLADSKLGMWKIVGINGAAATPFAICAGTAITTLAVTRQTGLPAGFLVISPALALFCVGLVMMAPHVRGPGMLYSYVALGLGRAAGVGAGAVSQLTYNLLQVSMYGLVGAAAAPLLADVFGMVPPWWVSATIACLLVGFLGPRKLKIVVTVLQVMLVAEVAVLGLYGAANLVNPAGAIPWHTLSPANFTAVGAGVLLASGLLGFVGFETAAPYNGHARRGHRTVLGAMFVTLAALTVLYLLSSFALISAVGADQVVDTARTQGVGMVFELARVNIGPWSVPVGEFLLLTSVLAAALSLHTTSNAYTYSLAAEGVWLRFLGRKNPATDQPQAASVAQCALGLAVIAVFAVRGWDPVVGLLYIGAAAGGLGVLVLLTMTAISVVVHFLRVRPDQPQWLTHVIPMASALLLSAALVLVLTTFDVLLGPSAGPGLRWGIPAAFAVVLLGGIARGFYLRRHQPSVWERLGYGPGGTAPMDTEQIR